MKFKIILSLILALAVMTCSRELSLRKRLFLVIQKCDIRIEHLTVTVAGETGRAVAGAPRRPL